MTAPRRARVLAHLTDHPGQTVDEIGLTLGLRGQLYQTLRDMEAAALVVAVTRWRPEQGREVSLWSVAPPGTVPPPRPAPDPEAARRHRERETAAQRARRARRAPSHRPGLRVAPPALDDAACRTADPDLFFGPDAERVTDRRRREAQAKEICAGCPARAACLAYALDTGQAFGIWGGADEDERRAMLRQAARRAS